jgi:uncharacterized repeat protein (TIGR03833 family)
MNNKVIHEFAIKWLKKFEDPKATGYDLCDNPSFGKDCLSFGLEMDCGKSFEKKYPGRNISDDSEALEKVINDITDIKLLGSAIFSQWRYYNHWAYSYSDIAEPKVRSWFIVALTRLIELTAIKSTAENGHPQKVSNMQNNTIRKNVPPGTHVLVVKKEDQRTGKLTEGIVKDILTNEAVHPRGIKVRLEDGTVGRVQKICEE